MNTKRSVVLVACSLVLLIAGMSDQVLSAPAQYAEAPMLAAKVTAGELPPVADRLPETPLVITPFRETGRYGGEFRFPFVGENPGRDGLYFIAGWEWLVAWNDDVSGIVPNAAERWEINADATQFTFFLRKGLKWSDGAPFTADDVLFYIEDIVQNPDINPKGTAGWIPAGVSVTAQKLDSYAFQLTFSKPYGMFLYVLAQYEGGRYFTFYPKHWLQQFHQKYNSDGLPALIAADGQAKDWIELFKKQAVGISTSYQQYLWQPQRPVIYPWIVAQPLTKETPIRLERNPYYWKVDSAGNQLPYIDAFVGTSLPDLDTLTLATIGGNFDIVHNPRRDDFATYQDTLAQSGFTFYYPIEDTSNVASIHLNKTHPDPVKAQIFGNKDFRIGLSHAMNRSEIINLLYNGSGMPWQIAPLQGSPLYIEQLATQYLDYDVAQANQSLDRVLPNKDAAGVRVTEDGTRFTFALTVANQFGQPYARLAELLSGYWKQVGLDVSVNAVAVEEREALREQNLLEATIFTAEGGAGLTGLLDPRYYVPGFYWSLWSNGYALYYNQSSKPGAVEPDAFTQQQQERYQNVMSVVSEEERIQQMRAILQTAADEFYCLGIATPGPLYQPFNAKLGNIPDFWINGWIEGIYKIIRPEQWYFKE